MVSFRSAVGNRLGQFFTSPGRERGYCRQLRSLLFTSLSLFAVIPPQPQAHAEHDLPEAIKNQCALNQVPSDSRFEAMKSGKALCALYGSLNWNPVWIADSSRVHEALHLVQRSNAHGLNREWYHFDELVALHDKTALTERLLFEFTLTRAIAQLLIDASTGCRAARLKEDPIGAAAVNREEIALQQVTRVFRAANLRRAVEEAYPNTPAYQKLRAALEDTRRAHEETPLSLPHTVRKGETSTLLPLVRERLLQQGFFAATGEHPELFTEADEKTIREFQEARGLTPDGTLGKKTMLELNAQPSSRIATLRANLERLRWEQASLPDLLVEVNIPDFRLTLYESGKPTLSMPVIVGKPITPTALFSAAITGVTFNPWWRVPTSIVHNELLSQLRKDPRRATAHGMEVRFREDGTSPPLDVSSIDWHQVPRSMASRIEMRQQPGPHNPLGTLKFEMPNPHTIYLHDTPSKSLFINTTRAFSHGCIRLGDPKALAVALLGGEEHQWGITQIDEAVQSHQTRTVRVRPQVPVRTVYRTAWVDSAGRLQLRPDLYRLDEALLRSSYFSRR